MLNTNRTNRLPISFGVIVLLLLASALTSFAAGANAEPRHFLHGNIPKIVASLHALEALPVTNQLHLAISLPLRNQAELDDLLKKIYDPASASYHQYLTPAQFTEKFGPTESDYQAVISFAQKNALKVTGTHPNRVVLDVVGSVADIEKAFQMTLHLYQHPKESRKFYAPDAEPSVEANVTVPILSISGLDDYSLPQPSSLQMMPVNQSTNVIPNSGTGTGGSYRGLDFRSAYVPGTLLNGTGQSVALVEFDGYYSNDIAAYEKISSLPYATLIKIPINGGVRTPGSGNVEVALDIEMVVSMATNISSVLVYEAPQGTSWVTILSQIANDNLAAQVSCSWGGGSPNAAAEQIFQQMAAQGQSFFNASGDSDAFVGSVPFPSDSPNITEVGGTTLVTIRPGGPWLAETAWNSGGGLGSSGGISTFYSIPIWQQGINSFLTNGGSTTARNVPDVALTANNVYVGYNNGGSTIVVGTSCAAPLWAGFMALVNQQAVAAGKPAVGFINPAVYEIANESIYLTAFSDITKGSNTWSSSPNAFFAVTGYDLCTGLGTPKGTNLINALVSPDPFIIVSNGGFNAVGTPAGMFNIAVETFYLTNAGSAPLVWSMVNTSIWLNVSNSSGMLAVGGSDSVVISLNTVASNLTAGIYAATLSFSNVTSHIGHARFFTLQTSDPLVIQPPKFLFDGLSGEPLAPVAQFIILTNPSASTFNWSINNTSVWFNVSPTAGSLLPGTQASVTVTPTSASTNLTDGFYAAIFQVTNQTSQFVQAITGAISVGIVENGGFESGDFTGWTLVGNGYANGTLYNGVISSTSLTSGSGSSFIHSGTYGAFLGDTNLATLSQTIQTTPGQNYLLSFWVDNPIAATPQQFLVDWNTNSTSTNQIYLLNNPAVLAWRKVTFIVGATDTNTTLVFGALNPTNAFGLDDISVVAVNPPVFTSQPTNVTVLAGGTAAFSATANGFAPLAYQWFDNGSAVSGATGNILTLTGVTTNNAGNYTVVITNTYGSATSSVAALTVVLPPSIAGVVANPDGTVTLNLVGSPGVSYILESTTNIISASGWQPVATNVIGVSGIWSFNDFEATNFPQLFYRLKYTQ